MIHKSAKSFGGIFLIMLLLSVVALSGFYSRVAADDYTYSGTITDSSNNPAANAQVGLLDGSAGHGSLVANTFTDSNGHFNFNISSGTYYITLSGSGPNSTSYQINLNTPINLTSGNITQDFQLPNLNETTLTIDTKDSFNNPIPGQYVSYAEYDADHTSSGIPGSYGLNLAAGASTDNNGQASMPLFTGTDIEGQAFTDYLGSTISQDLPSTVSGDVSINLVEPQTHTYSGNITDSSGNPVINAQVGLFNGPAGQGGLVANTFADSNGHFNITALGDTYYIRVSGPGPNGTSFQVNLNDPADLTSGDVTQNLQLPDLNAATLTVNMKDFSDNIVPGRSVSYAEYDPTHTSSGISGSYGLNLAGGFTADSNGHLDLPLFLGANVEGQVYADYYGTNVTQVLPDMISGDLTFNLTGPGGTAPTITSDSTVAVGQRQELSFPVTTTGNPAAAISESGALPDGINFHDNGDGTATITGKPAAGTAGDYTITITADNGIGDPVTQSFTLTVTAGNSAPAITTADSLTELYGSPVSFTVDTTGYPAPNVTKTGALPAGLSFTNNHDGTATIAGTPSGAAKGVYSLTIKAQSSAGTTTQTFTLTVNRPPTITNISTKTGQVGTAISVPITSTAYPIAALTLSEPGALPVGLSLTDNGDGTGTISGTPVVGTGGLYSVTVNATNDFGTGTETFTLKINEGPVFTSVATTTATIGTPLSFQVTASGYPAPNITKTSGTLPAGVTWNNTGKRFQGTAHAGTAGSYPITLTATNSSATVTQNFILTVN